MKKVLLVMGAALFSALWNRSISQCQISAPAISFVKAPQADAQGCRFTVDLSFEQKANNGFKYQTIMLWTEAAYNGRAANFYGKNNAKTPSAAEVDASNALAAISVDVEAKAALSSFFGETSSKPASFKNNVAVSITPAANGFDLVTVKNIEVFIPAGCSNPVALMADVLGTQAKSWGTIHCISQELIGTLGELAITGVKNCGRTPTVSFAVENTTGSRLDFTYQLFADDGDGIAEFDGADIAVSDVSAAYRLDGKTSSGEADKMVFENIVINTSGAASAYAQNGVWVRIVSKNRAASAAQLLEPVGECATLPVKLSSFTAARNKTTKQQVDLAWTTAQEQHNKGFYLQRKTDGEWKDIAFVFSAAENGTSTNAITYRFKDQNLYNGVTQYRLLQVDMDGKATYSEVRSLMGETQKTAVVVYPNPAVSGKVNLLFADASARTVVVNDMSGRVVKQYANLAVPSLSIEGLTKGFYTIKVVQTKTGEVSVEKVIVP